MPPPLNRSRGSPGTLPGTSAMRPRQAFLLPPVQQEFEAEPVNVPPHTFFQVLAHIPGRILAPPDGRRMARA
jgi:hypothetical protein